MMSFLSMKKGQAAMEFLMTYGWAILVVLVVIGALAYFGVLSPSNLLPEKCTFPVSLSCVDFRVSATDSSGVSPFPDAVTVVLQNGAGRDMDITSIDAVSDALGGAAGNGVANTQCKNGTGFTLRNGEKKSVILNVPVGGTSRGCDYRNTGRDKNRYKVNVTYGWLDSRSLNHTINGELLAKAS